MEGYSAKIAVFAPYRHLLGSVDLLKQVTVRLVEQVLLAEMTQHLRSEPNQPKPTGAINGRNGCPSKTLLTDHGEVIIDTPPVVKAVMQGRIS